MWDWNTSEHIWQKTCEQKHDARIQRHTTHTHTHKPGTASLSFGGAIQSWLGDMFLETNALSELAGPFCMMSARAFGCTWMHFERREELAFYKKKLEKKKKNWEGSCVLRTCHGRPKQKGSPVHRVGDLQGDSEMRLSPGSQTRPWFSHPFTICLTTVILCLETYPEQLDSFEHLKNSRSIVRIVSRLVARLPGSMKHIMWDHCSRCWSPGWWWGEQPTGGGLTKGADFNFQEWAGADSGQHHSWTTRNTRHTRTTGT